MKIAVAFKVVHDDQDINVKADRALDYSRAGRVVSTYDLNAIEAAAQLAAASEGSTVTALTVGDAGIDNSKLKKNVLARGVDDLRMVADDACAGLDAHATALVLGDMVEELGGFDVIVCGDGSADDFAQQVDVQLAARLGVPVVTSATNVQAKGGVLEVERTLEDVVETVEVECPCVVSVTPDMVQPRIPGMKDVLAAGKKPMNVTTAATAHAATLETVSCLAPEQAARKQEIMDAAEDGAIERFAQAIKAAL
ncbi:MAG TPA: electron transfer flavoprotein [Candidatus Aveggerthella excrementigallinarum]|nr:electron transfer flavoprotein [Candidatus Aveggerthella excrementigallinarum]